MDKQSLLNKISFILQDLKTQHLKLTGNVDRIAEIDLDLFLANANFLVHHLDILKKINGSNPNVRDRDEMIKNLFDPSELEKILEFPVQTSEHLPESFREIAVPTEKREHLENSPSHIPYAEVSPLSLLPEPSAQAEKVVLNALAPTLAPESKPVDPYESTFGEAHQRYANSIHPVSEVSPSASIDVPQEIVTATAVSQSRNDSFVEAKQNFLVPLSNKQGVFAPELHRKAALQSKAKAPNSLEFSPKDQEVFGPPTGSTAYGRYGEITQKDYKTQIQPPSLGSPNSLGGSNVPTTPNTPSGSYVPTTPNTPSGSYVPTPPNTPNTPGMSNVPTTPNTPSGSYASTTPNTPGGSSVPNFHQVLSSQKREPSLLNTLGNLPVKDIRKAIGLNEHLLFIKTLFHGDPAVYDRTLTMIDSLKTSEQAFLFLQAEIAGPYNWDTKKAVAELFKNIVNRKFAGNR